MSFGYKNYASDGTLTYSTDDATWTLLATRFANANTNHTWTDIPTMPTRIVTRGMTNQLVGDDEGYCHTFTLSGSTLTATGPSSTNTAATFFMVFGK